MDVEDQKKQGCRIKNCCCGYKISICVLTPLGILIAVAANFFPKLYTDTVKKQLVLLKGSEAYNNWYNPPAPVYMTYHVFNYTNIDEMLDNTAHPVRPKVSQIGPFVYREIRINDVLDYNEHNITYLQNYSYVFEPTLSCNTCDENNTVFVPSISAMTVLQDIGDKAKDAGWWTQLLVNPIVSAEVSLFKQLTVRQAIWGYDDDLLIMLKKIEGILKMFGVELPDLTRIALQHNSTEGAEDIGNVTMLTGKDNIDDVQRIVRWRGLDEAPYWLNKYGRMINGTDGTHAPPFLTREYRMYVFVTQLCRSLYFSYEKDVTFKDIKMFRFTTTAMLFMNASVNPDNKAFCSSNNTCWGSGLLCISKCQPGGVPIFMSAPHFYNGDPKFSDRIDGLKPNKTLHATIADVEPITGITMRAYKRLQINVLAQKSWLDVSQPLQHEFNFLPMLMIEESAIIDDASASKFRNMVYLPRTFMVGNGPYYIMAAGVIMILIAIIFIYMVLKDNYQTSYDSEETVSVKRTISEEKRDEFDVSIRKVDSSVTIIPNMYT